MYLINEYNKKQCLSLYTQLCSPHLWEITLSCFSWMVHHQSKGYLKSAYKIVKVGNKEGVATDQGDLSEGIYYSLGIGC